MKRDGTTRYDREILNAHFGGLVLNEMQEMSQVTDSQVKKKKKKKGFINVIPSVGQVRCRPFRRPRQRGIRVRGYRFEKTVRLFPGGGKKGGREGKRSGEIQERRSKRADRGEAHVKFYSIPLSPRERNPI